MWEPLHHLTNRGQVLREFRETRNRLQGSSIFPRGVQHLSRYSTALHHILVISLFIGEVGIAPGKLLARGPPRQLRCGPGGNSKWGETNKQTKQEKELTERYWKRVIAGLSGRTQERLDYGLLRGAIGHNESANYAVK